LSSGRQTPLPGDDRLERILSRVGPRPVPSEVATARVREAVTAAWSDKMRRRARRRFATRLLMASAAASVLLAAVLVRVLLPYGGGADPGVAVAHVELQAGEVQLTPPLAGEGAGLPVGTRIRSGPKGRLALRFTGGPALRVDVGTTVRIESPGVIVLDRGRIYVDSGPGGAGDRATLAVRTALGEVRELGTQFSVDLGDSHLRVGVREGRIEVQGDGAAHEAVAGEELTLGADTAVSRRELRPDGPEWEWIGSITPTPDIDGLLLGTYLDWVARETGRAIVFDDPAVATLSRSIELSGSIAGLSPAETLTAVLPTCGLVHHVESGRYVIAANGDPEPGD